MRFSLWLTLFLVILGITELESPSHVLGQTNPLEQPSQDASKSRSFHGLSFYTLCTQKNDLATDTRTTIEIILNRLHTNNCEIAATELNRSTSLNLSDTGISDLSPLTTLPQLNQLDICCNRLSNIVPLSELTNLHQVDLSYNRITNIKPLAKLVKLTHLDLSYNEITNLRDLTNLINLQRLYLSFNQVNDVTPLAQLIKLIDLDLWGNLITDIHPLQNLPRLQKLSLTGNPLELKVCPVQPSSICIFGYETNNQ